jgi:hypothetical protein
VGLKIFPKKSKEDVTNYGGYHRYAKIRRREHIFDRPREAPFSSPHLIARTPPSTNSNKKANKIPVNLCGPTLVVRADSPALVLTAIATNGRITIGAAKAYSKSILFSQFKAPRNELQN